MASVEIEVCLGGDGDLAGFALLMLWDNDGEQAVFHARSNTVLIDTRWECKSTLEGANAALGDPEFRLRRFRLSAVVLLAHFRRTLSSSFILDRGLVGGVVCIFDCTLRWGGINEAGRRCSRVVAALSTAFDRQGVGIGELDLHILLFYSGELAMEFVCILDFLYIEFRSEALQASVRIFTITLATVLIEVVEHTEEWLKGVGRVGSEE